MKVNKYKCCKQSEDLETWIHNLACASENIHRMVVCEVHPHFIMNLRHCSSTHSQPTETTHTSTQAPPTHLFVELHLKRPSHFVCHLLHELQTLPKLFVLFPQAPRLQLPFAGQPRQLFAELCFQKLIIRLQKIHINYCYHHLVYLMHFL